MIGGSLPLTYSVGLAARAFSGHVRREQPRRRDSGELVLSGAAVIASRSVGGEKATAACTALETPSVPTLPSSSGRSPVTAAIAAVQPPELPPMIPMWSASSLYCAACVRNQRMAALISYI